MATHIDLGIPEAEVLDLTPFKARAPEQGGLATGFDEAFMKPAMALENIGDVAEPSQGIYGYYIVQYAADIPEGSVALDTVRESIHEKLLTAKQDAAFVETGDQWVAEADIKTFTDRMKD